MFRRSLVAVVALLGLVFGATVAVPGHADAQVDLGSDNTPAADPRAQYGDEELIQALQATDLLEDWLASSPVSDTAALLRVSGSASYADARQAFLDRLASFRSGHRHVADRELRIAQAQKDRDLLSEVVARLRRSLTRNEQAHEVLATLDLIESQTRWLGVSLDPLTLAEHRMGRIRDEIDRNVRAIGTDRNAAKGVSAAVIRLGELQDDLVHLDELIRTARDRGQDAVQAVEAHRVAAIELIPELHRARTLNTSEIGGLPLVTVDAYIRAAEVLDNSCPVDWALLGGIGRIESRHGTLDNASVQVSGRLTRSIYGPLLDGGATEREAAAALIAAEEEALLAEAEAAIAAQIAADEAFDNSVWGQLKREEEGRNADEGTAVQRDEPSADESKDEAEGEEVPTFDPRLWGESSSVKNDDPPADPMDEDADAGEDSEESEEDELEFRGNGFAVIADSDNGRLDGNPRWDRAVGPMQFIPETWSYWETDGNGDGVLDPQNLYDSAASAGRFLCHLSRTRGSSPWTFVLGYNSSNTYVRNVMTAADALRIAELPDVDALRS